MYWITIIIKIKRVSKFKKQYKRKNANKNSNKKIKHIYESNTVKINKFIKINQTKSKEI